MNKELMIEILKERLDNGYEIIRHLNVDDKEFSTAVVNMFEVAKTIEQLQQENDFDKEMNDIAKRDREALDEILSKNEEVSL